MSLTQCLQSAVDCVFDTFSEFAVTGVFVLPANVYDPVTGTTSGDETDYPITEIIFIDYELSRIDGQIIRRLDKQALFKVSEISVPVTDNMILRLSGGDEWDVINVVKDPSNILYEVQCRRP